MAALAGKEAVAEARGMQLDLDPLAGERARASLIYRSAAIAKSGGDYPSFARHLKGIRRRVAGTNRRGRRLLCIPGGHLPQA
jgi:hypothetical protein